MKENKHTKRINDIFIDENVLYTCSNDASCRLYDLKTNKLIKSFKSKQPNFENHSFEHIF